MRYTSGLDVDCVLTLNQSINNILMIIFLKTYFSWLQWYNVLLNKTFFKVSYILPRKYDIISTVLSWKFFSSLWLFPSILSTTLVSLEITGISWRLAFAGLFPEWVISRLVFEWVGCRGWLLFLWLDLLHGISFHILSGVSIPVLSNWLVNWHRLVLLDEETSSRHLGQNCCNLIYWVKSLTHILLFAKILICLRENNDPNIEEDIVHFVLWYSMKQ